MAYSDADPDVQRARSEVRRFRQHFITYVAVIGLLFIINALTGGFWFGHWWFFWIALIWGVILALEAAHLFGDNIGREWEDRMVDQLVARRKGRAAGAPPPGYTPPSPPRPPGSAAYGPPAPPANAPVAGDPSNPATATAPPTPLVG